MTMLGKKHTEETKEKMRLAKQKVREIRRRGRDCFGRFLSGDDHPSKRIEIRNKISHSQIGRIPWNKGKKGVQTMSIQTRQKMSISQKNRTYWNTDGIRGFWKGKTLSDEHVAKLTESRKHRIIPRKDTKPERMMQLALLLHNIKFDKHKALVGQPDIFIAPNLCIFVDGDFIHANPEKYKADDYIIHNRYAKDIWARDTFVNHELNKQGYHIIRIWASEIQNDANECAINILNLVTQLKQEKENCIKI